MHQTTARWNRQDRVQYAQNGVDGLQRLRLSQADLSPACPWRPLAAKIETFQPPPVSSPRDIDRRDRAAGDDGLRVEEPAGVHLYGQFDRRYGSHGRDEVRI